jgi:predicted PurR-regulated permease PerM
MDQYLPKLSERQQRWARFLALLVVIGLLVWVAMALRQVLTPLVAALALAYILNPLVTWLEETRKIKRVTSVSLGLALLLVVGASLLFAGTVQIVQLAGDIPEHATAALEWLNQTVPGLLSTAQEPGATENRPAVSGTGQEPTSDARERLAQLATEHGLSLGRSVVGYIGRIVSNAFYWLSLTVLLPLYTFFFLLNFNEIIHAARDHLPSAYRPTIVRIVTTIDGAIATFFRGRLLVCLAVGTLTGVGWLSLGLLGVHVPYNLALGALAGTLNLVPFLSVLALPPALLLTYLDATAGDDNWVLAVTLVFAVYLLVQALETFVLTPVIEAKASGLHPVTTVIALLIGGQLAGLLGMLLAIPLTSTLKSLGIEYLLPEVRRLAEAETDTSAAEDTS